ncbi:hypothetical protein KSS87_001156 [Heliosperma pusillum]|nr:hypothetical protein KSS87_001156 [Heliosperma pusillum]
MIELVKPNDYRYNVIVNLARASTLVPPALSYADSGYSMPGNEIGDRVYNFFDQNSFSQNQRHTQFADANWPSFHSNVWGENERQNSAPLNSSSKCYNDQQSEIERGNNQFSPASHGLNFTESNVRPDFVKSPSQVQQLNLNGFMHTRQVGNSRQNEANFLAVNRGSDQHNITSRVPSIVETQQRSVQQHNNMNFNFLGSQQQMSSQQPGMLNDGQLMQQQQVIIKQMQELQRRQQLQQFEAMQNAMNHMSNIPTQSAGQHSMSNNGNPVQDTSNNPWQSQGMAGGTNWQQPGNPYLNGLMVNSEQGQAIRFMGLTPHQSTQSLYGVPVSNSSGVHRFQQNSVLRPGVSHIPAHSSTFSGNPYAPHLQQVGTQDASTTSRLEGKNSFEHPFSQGLQNAVNLGGSNQVQERKASMPDGGERGFVGVSDESSEKSSMQAAASQSTSSQAGVGLDPAEEKILFGNDDNIWEAFGGASVTGNDGADLFNGLPSMQSGTWSALMQSAVAETSNSDGMQEEWNGLESQTSRSQSNNQHLPTSHDNGQPSPAWVDSSQRASLGCRMTNNDVNTSNATSNTNYLNNSRSLQSHSNQGSSSIENQVLHEGRRWLDSNSPKPHSEEKCGSKPDTVFWSHRQSTFLPESIPVSNTNSKVDSGGRSSSHINNSPVSNQMPPDNHNLDLWKRFDLASKSGIVGHGIDQHNMNNGQSVAGASANTPSGGASEMPGTQSGDGRENSNDIQQNSIPNYALPGSLRENVWSDAGDRQLLSAPQEISRGPVGRRMPIARNFQYHPMVDINVDESSSAKQVVHPQSMSPSLGPRVHEMQPTLLGQAGSSSADKEKGQVSGFHGGVKMFHGALSSNVHPGHLPRSSVPYGSFVENSTPNQRLSPSQNMLELLHKVDQSKEQNSVSNLGSSSVNYNNKSETPADGRVGPGQSHSSMSHGFNLQLAPPSQGTASNLHDPAQSSLRSLGSPGSRIVSSEKGVNTQAWLPSNSTTLCSPPPHRPPQMDFGNSEQLMDNHQSSYMSSESHAYHDKRSTNSQNQAAVSQCTSNPYNSSMSEDMNLSGVRASMYQMPTSVNAVMDGMMKDNMPLVGPNSRSSHQKLSDIEAHNTSSFVKSHFQSNDPSDRNVVSQQKKDELDCPRNTDLSHAADPQPSSKTTGLSQEKYLRRQSMDASHVISAASQKEADVVNHSFKPNNTANYSYSLLHQMQTMNPMGMDPNHQESKKLKSSGPDAPQTTSNSTARDPSVSQTSMSFGDAKMASFPPQLGNNNISLLPPGAVASQDGFSFGHSDPQTFVNVTNRAQLTGISPQMAPSWFERYGTFRNGQLLPVHNVPRVPMAKTVEQQLINPPINLVDTSQISGTNQISNVCSATEHISSLHALAPNVASATPVSTRLKKRKTETSDLIPWNKEIGQGFKKVQNISSAEVEWAQASNRLVERGGDETDFHEYLSPLVRPGRRLILTTKLMQQVFGPPPASILSLDGRSNGEVIMYSVSRLALADASSLICDVESDTPVNNGISLTTKAKTSERIRDQYFLKVVEDFTNRAKELENDLIRLDKSASILDFRLDCQDLERFSVINRFARFHARSQVDGVETSSSSNSNAVSHKPFPQRYVTAHPMPSSVPEGVQCLTIN